MPFHQEKPVGCVCNGGKVWVGGLIPHVCPHCNGSGSIPREKYLELTKGDEVTAFLVALWLGAITAANLISAKFGPEASMVNAFFLIGLTLVTRDQLHDAWQTGRVWKMGLLIATGSTVAYLVTPDAGKIALASGAAFLVAESLDAIVYHAVRFLPWLERSNISNFAGAAADSLIFPTIAFGGFAWSLTIGQFGAKVAGALMFTLLLARLGMGRRIAIGTDEGALEAVRLGILKPHEAPLAVLRDAVKRANA